MKTEHHPAQAPKPPYAQLADARLAELTAAGDVNAYSFVYDRHFEEIFDFGVRTARAAGPAAEAVVEAFAEVWQQAGAGKAGLDLRPELFAAARGALLADSRIAHSGGKPPEGSQLPEGYSVQAPGDVQATMPAAEYADLVWRASASLNPRDYSLLHINLRGAISIPDMADALGLKRKQLEPTLRKLKESLNRSVGSILLMREGHKNCPELDGLIHKLKSADTSPGEIRKEVGEHMEACRRCGATRRAYSFPPDTLAALLPVAAPQGLKRELWERIVRRIESGPAPKPALFASRRAASDGGVAAVKRGRKPEWMRIAAVITVIALVAAAATAILQRDPPAEVDDPIDVRSASHSLWVPSPTDVVRLGWSPVQGATGFSVEWTKKTRDLPDETVDLAGTATSVQSDPLSNGSWYFHLRTRDKNNRWTSTVHLGPFVIRKSQASPTPGTPGGLELIPVSPSASPSGLSLSVADVTLAEGNSGAVNATVAVTLSSRAPQEVSVEYSTANKTATAPADYKAAKGKLTFSPRQTRKTFTVPVVPDTVVEPNETFLVNLKNPVGAVLGRATATVTITNDDGVTPVAISIADAQANEGAVLSFAVTLSGPAKQAVSVGYATANGSAAAPADFTGAVGAITFGPGQTSATLSIQTAQDTSDEPNETMTVTLANPVGPATIADASAAGTIVDDDEPLPSLAISDGTVPPDGPGERQAVFTVTRSGSTTGTSTVKWATAPDTASEGDFVAASGTLTFGPTETSKTITIAVDGIVLGDQTFLVKLSEPTDATLERSQGKATI